jgi:hypothetical protein
VVGYHGTLEVVVYDPRADVGGAGYVAGVSQPLGDRVDGFEDVFVRVFWLRRGPQLGELDGGDQGPSLRPEVFGRELVAHNLLDVEVEIPGLNVAHLAIIHVFEDLVAR